MLTLMLRRDIARARALADHLDHYNDQLHFTYLLGRERYVDFLGTPRGLLLSFAAGCLLSAYSSRQPDGAGSLLKLMQKAASL